MPSEVCLCLFACTLALLFAITSPAQVVDHHSLIGQLNEAKLKITQLESTLEHVVGDVDAIDRRLEDSDKRIEELEKNLVDLYADIKKLNDEVSAGDRKITALEEEIRILWTMLRRNNFDIHVLKTRAAESEERLDKLASHAEKITDVVSERWIQIQQFEQALQLVEMRLIKAKRVARYSRCTFLKFMDDLHGRYIQRTLRSLNQWLLGDASAMRPYVSYIVEQLKRFFATVKESHFEVQSLIKQIMEDYELTASIANSEVVFFMASALIVFPVMSAWLLLSSHLQ
ncbi:hypothetical protein LINGRAHAP2_LOCUS5551 [Linum grandiflorum]